VGAPVRLIVNDSAGQHDETLAGRLAGACTAHRLDAEIVIAHSPEEIGSLADAAASSGASIVAAAGGDGTVSAVAARLAGSNVRLGVVPSGTLNHFAKDLGLPLPLEEAVATLAAGHDTPIDVGEVNGRCFINNSSLGLYPSVVLERREQQLHGRSKWLALLLASMKVSRRYPRMLVALKSDQAAGAGQVIVVRTPFVFVGNNEYAISRFELGGRRRLDAGVLSVSLATGRGRGSLAWLFARAAAGVLDGSSRGFQFFTTQELEIQPATQRVRVSLDGEVRVMQGPLRYRCRHGVLRVIVPTQS
jgi:diacylglycerol kinase family enzyme